MVTLMFVCMLRDQQFVLFCRFLRIVINKIPTKLQISKFIAFNLFSQHLRGTAVRWQLND